MFDSSFLIRLRRTGGTYFVESRTYWNRRTPKLWTSSTPHRAVNNNIIHQLLTTRRFQFLHRSYRNWTVYAGRQYVRSSVRSCVRPSFAKCTIMHNEQTAGHGSDNSGAPTHVDKIHPSAGFHSNRQRLWTTFSRSQIRIEYIGKFTCDYLTNGDS